MSEPKRYGAAAVLRTIRLGLRIMLRLQPSFLFDLIAAGVFQAALPFVAVFLPKLVLDELTGGRDIGRIVALVAGAAVLSGVCYALSGLFALRRNRGSQRFEKYIERAIGEETMTMDYPHLEDPETLTLIQQYRQGRMTSGGFEGAFGWALVQGLPALLTLIGLTGVLAQLNGWVLVALIACTALTLFILSKEAGAQSRMALENGDANRVFNYYIMLCNDFSYAKDVRLFAGQDMLIARILDTEKRIFASCMKGFTRIARCNAGQAVVSQAQMAILYLALGVQAATQGMSVGDFLMYATAALNFGTALLTVATSAMSFYNALQLIAPISRYMSLPDVLKKGGQPLPPQGEPGSAALELEHVTFTYPRASAPTLRDVSLTLRRGERLAIVGENGAGKTTLIKLLLRLYDPDEGRILLDGRDVTEISPEDYQSAFSAVFQDYRLWAFSVKENVCAGQGDPNKVRSALKRAGLADALAAQEKGEDTSVYRLFDESGVEFSGGERQKMAIARALYKDAPIVVMDEPTAALDPIAEAEIYGKLNDLIRDRTAVFISHRLSSCRFCDRVAVFSEGRVVECGSHDELMRQNGLYRRMFEAQAQYYV